METKELINATTNKNTLIKVIEDHPMLIPSTLGIMGIVWLGGKAIEKGRRIKLHLSKDISLEVD